MALHSAIEWTDASWNPVTGCTQVSPGCDHCYARTFAERFRGVPGHPYEQGFDLKLWPSRLELPLGWRQPKRVFVNSMSDLFHEDVPDEFIHRVFQVMERADWHLFQVLTKRPRRMAETAPGPPRPPPSPGGPVPPPRRGRRRRPALARAQVGRHERGAGPVHLGGEPLPQPGAGGRPLR